MANTFQFNTTTSEQIARGVADRSVCMSVTVRISDVHESTLKALPNMWVFGEQRGAKIHHGAFLVERCWARFFDSSVNQVKECVVVLIGEDPCNVAAIVS